MNFKLSLTARLSVFCPPLPYFCSSLYMCITFYYLFSIYRLLKLAEWKLWFLFFFFWFKQPHLLHSATFFFEVWVLFPIDFSERIPELFPQLCGSFVALNMMSLTVAKRIILLRYHMPKILSSKNLLLVTVIMEK